jgi:hypothetical protein
MTPGRSRVTIRSGYRSWWSSSRRSAVALRRLCGDVGTSPVGQLSSTGASSRFGEYAPTDDIRTGQSISQNLGGLWTTQVQRAPVRRVEGRPTLG